MDHIETVAGECLDLMPEAASGLPLFLRGRYGIFNSLVRAQVSALLPANNPSASRGTLTGWLRVWRWLIRRAEVFKDDIIQAEEGKKRA